MTVAFISHPDCLLHDMGPWHPEAPSRLSAITDQLLACGLEGIVKHYEAPLASKEQLTKVHDKAYVEHIMAIAPGEGIIRIDPDTSMNPHTLTAALRAAGAVVLAVDLAVRSETKTAFCSVRPPGHHAERGRAMGFCFFNNIAVGAGYALSEQLLSRVAIVDFDVHHGNGTEDIFRDEPRVLICSSFQHPLYPGSGADTKSDHIVNVPLAAGTSGSQFREAVENLWMPALHSFKPELIFVSAGFDAHVQDPLAHLALTEEDYAWVTTKIVDAANQHAKGRVVSALEGGYNLSALGRSVARHVGALEVSA